MPVCRECGSPTGGEFCKPPSKCKTKWNNRRKSRGAVLYDLLMSQRFDREAAEADHIWTLACRQMADWRVDDNRRRGGRLSWRGHKAVLQERPYLLALVGRI